VPDGSYHVGIIGGGIHGVGVAQRAAAQGYTVLVLEKSGLAAGTSSRSSKLIHGGLRYLENVQIGLVRECLRERSILLQIAPELVRLQPFVIPVYRNTRRRPWQLRLGLGLYALLGGMDKKNRFTTIPRRHWDQLDGLTAEGLEKVYCYWDAQTDDALLTRAVMNSAQELGAELAMPANFLDAKMNQDGWEVCYSCDGQQRTCQIGVLINAAGPWIHEVAQHIDPAPRLPAIELVQGAHIEMPGELSGGIYYLEAPRDGRAVFAMPWKDHTLVGTTETSFSGNPDSVRPLPQEEDYLLEALGHYFPRYRGEQRSAVLASFAGLRVLPAGSGGPFSRPRETILVVDNPRQPRLLTIVGGKLTAYRATAEKVVTRLAPALPKFPLKADTKTSPLSYP